jgi:hypothetical protein
MLWTWEGLTERDYRQLGLYLVLLGEETLQMQLPLTDPVGIGRPAPRPAPRGVLGQHLAQLWEINTHSASLASETVMLVMMMMMMTVTVMEGVSYMSGTNNSLSYAIAFPFRSTNLRIVVLLLRWELSAIYLIRKTFRA